MGQQPTPSAPGDHNFVYRSWNNQTGLPQNTVYDMVLDSTGYLWGATEEGLFRFDGAAFNLVNDGNTAGLHSNTFYALLSSGRDLWASGRNVILRIRDKVEQVWDLSNYINGGWIKCIEKDPSGRLWIGASNGKLYYLYRDSVYSCPAWNSGTFSSVEALTYTPRGMIVGTAQGLFSMDQPGATPKRIDCLDGIPITAIATGNGDELWIGTASKGLFRLSGDTVQYTEKEGLNENYINSLFFAGDGQLWVGLRSTGYQLFSKGRFITPAQDNFAHDGVRSIFVENEQLAWLGTNSSGLVQLKPALIGIPRIGPGLADKIILPVYQHPNGEIWVGTAGKGVFRYSRGRLSRYDRTNGLSNDLVLSVYGRDEYIFIGTSIGIDRFNTRTNTIDRHYTEKEGLQNNGVLCIFNDSHNRLWITTRRGGLYRMLEDGITRPFDLPASLERTTLLCAFEDSKHNIWIGSRGAGMFRIDEMDQSFHYHQKEKFPADIVYAFFEDQQGDIWMATDKGLVIYHHGVFRLFDKQSGLLFNEIYRILKDPAGYVWLSGNLGLQRIPVKDMLSAKDAISASKLPARLFNAVDGMPNSETNGGFFPAGWAMQDGTLWFPTAQGIAVVDHRLIGEESRKLNIHVQSLRYGNNKYFQGEDVQLPPGVFNIEIHYTSIDFSKASDIQFYVRLKGQKEEWTAAGDRRVAYFSSLAPGSYAFEVKAERYGVWSPTAVFNFTVRPSFYQTGWFKLLVIVLSLLAIGIFIWYLRHSAQRKIREQQRVTRAQIRGQEKERQFISTELHDSINQQLGTVKLYLDFAKTNDADRAGLIAKSEEMVQTVINDIRSLCNSLTPTSLVDIGLKEALVDLLNSYSSIGKFIIHLQFQIEADELEEDLQFTIFRITQEQMNNIARHSGAANVWLEFRATATAVAVTIRDDGQGFDLKTQKFGMGFENIRNRLILYRGKMDIKTAKGKGCSLSLHIPL